VEGTRLTDVDTPFRADARDYVMYGYNLANYGVYSRSIEGLARGEVPTPDARRSPGYPLFTVPFFAATDVDSAGEWIKWAQTLLSLVAVLLVFLLARRCLPFWGAWTAALLTALSPHLVNANVYWLTESLFTFQLVLTLWLFTRAMASESPAIWASLCGLSFAFAYLVRPTVLLFCVPLAALVFLHRHPRPWRLVVPAATSGALLCLLWLFTFAPDGEIGGGGGLRISMHHGMYPDFMYQDNPRSHGFPYRYDPRSEEIVASWDSLLAELERRFTEEPGRHLRWYLLDKPRRLFGWDIVQGRGDTFLYEVEASPYYGMPLFTWSHRLMYSLQAPMMSLMLLAIGLVGVASARRWLPARQLLVPQLVALLLVYFVAIHLPVAPFPRYSIPLRPFCGLLAAWACWITFRRAMKARQPADHPPAFS
jgi:4-amino-4-deoxy-L-arabinose transferase-like glycosyltransferase